ncbi:MAG: glycosyltransferase family 2 protein [Elusimicrobia bacterium]|nr:glycosyltransferase family 2 protein [Elusimicrobiota bacterium]
MSLEPQEVSIVVPVFNGERSLPELVRRLESVLTDRWLGFEVILVNDGSRDGSWDVICGLAKTRAWLRGMDMMRNYGQHSAVLCGTRAARYSVIVTMDDDLQHPPEEIPKLLEELSRGFDIVYGTPEREEHEFWRRWASRLTKMALTHFLGARTARHVSAFRALRSELREVFDHYNGPFVSFDVLLSWATDRFSAVFVRHETRRGSESNYSVGRLVVHAIDMVTGFSSWPLRGASLLGFGFTILGGGLLVYVVGRRLLMGAAVQGFAFLASAISLFAGVQLFSLGVLGEYVARLHARGMGRPPYAVRRTVQADR